MDFTSAHVNTLDYRGAGKKLKLSVNLPFYYRFQKTEVIFCQGFVDLKKMQVEYAQEVLWQSFTRLYWRNVLYSGCSIYAYSSCFWYFLIFVKNQFVCMMTDVIGFVSVGIVKVSFFFFALLVLIISVTFSSQCQMLHIKSCYSTSWECTLMLHKTKV